MMVKATNKKLKLNDQLILNQYMLQILKVESFEDLTKDMKDSTLEDLDIDNFSKFYKYLSTKLVNREELNIDVLRQYDENIVSHTLRINQKREKKIKWKYFQYISLLFTEIYLDRYFHQRKKLLEDLNACVSKFNQNNLKSEKLSYYDEKSLKKLAFWNATGSGKTLLMHVNILQYKHYFYRNYRQDELEQVILLTPSESLSNQHLREFEASGLQASLFEKSMQGLFRGEEVAIIDIHKLKDEMGEKTVAIDAFEGNNLVLVDEGHRGSSGDEWRIKREKLSEQGFAFEYSATFGQAVSGKKELSQEYAKCILFDYSYRYFYRDGYGKDYRILNLKDDEDEYIRHLYLMACLTSFYQQMKLYKENNLTYRPFSVEKPLWVFVGGSVNALRVQNKRKVSDVTNILLFIARFIKESKESISMIERLMSGKPGLLDGKGKEIFANSFPYLADKQMSAEDIYKGILLLVFNSTITNGTLQVENLKGVDGEISLRIGQQEPFGIINVGDTNQLIKLCNEYPELFVTERDFSDSYFQHIDEKNSPINLLIGSKKFTEGWSSWRVSTMGLMNMGRSEGSQIIQLFGRGVRLKGYNFSLKRSEALKDELTQIPQYLNYIETLNIFGVRADYMQQFKEYLEDEGIPTDVEYEEMQLPILKNYNEKKLKLKALRLKEGINFKKQGPNPSFSAPTERLIEKDRIVVNWYPKLQVQVSSTKGLSVREMQVANVNKETFSKEHIAFMDINRIYFEMQRFKRERSWHNLSLSKEEIVKLLSNNYWYEIEIPKQELVFSSFNKVKRWEEIAIVLLKKYCEKQYLYAKKEWEAPHMEYYELAETDSNFIEHYNIAVDVSDASMISTIKKLTEQLKEQNLSEVEFGGFKSFAFSQHLYDPLITLEGAAIKVSPVPLNEGEYNFVEDLKTYYECNEAFFKDKELYLLRNQSRGKGIGFFEAGGFYPDFILWILHEDKQYVIFVDPKGIRNLSITDSKLQFYDHIKEIGYRLKDKNVILSAFTIANTYYSDLVNTGVKLSKDQMEEQHILFQNDDRSTYIDKMIRKILKEDRVIGTT